MASPAFWVDPDFPDVQPCGKLPGTLALQANPHLMLHGRLTERTCSKSVKR